MGFVNAPLLRSSATMDGHTQAFIDTGGKMLASSESFFWGCCTSIAQTCRSATTILTAGDFVYRQPFFVRRFDSTNSWLGRGDPGLPWTRARRGQDRFPVAHTWLRDTTMSVLPRSCPAPKTLVPTVCWTFLSRCSDFLTYSTS